MNTHLFFLKRQKTTHQGLMHALLTNQEVEIIRILVQRQPGQMVCETYLEKNHHKKGLEEWLRWRS
jgi:hypothetical protein